MGVEFSEQIGGREMGSPFFKIVSGTAFECEQELNKLNENWIVEIISMCVKGSPLCLIFAVKLSKITM